MYRLKHYTNCTRKITNFFKLHLPILASGFRCYPELKILLKILKNNDALKYFKQYETISFKIQHSTIFFYYFLSD